MDTPREDLVREASFEVVRSDESGDGLTLEGYAAVFGSPTRIDSVREGRFDEVIAPGAFKRTLGHKGAAGIRLQFDHGSHPLIGSMPLGTFTEMREDPRGLFVKARLMDNWLISPVRDAIRAGAVSGMSFRFSVPSNGDVWDESTDPPTRTLREVNLAEAGPVVWPAYDDTSVGVRAQQIARELMDPEQRELVARALLTGISSEPADGTSLEHAESDSQDDSPHGTRLSLAQLQRLRRISKTAKELRDEDTRGDSSAAA